MSLYAMSTQENLPVSVHGFCKGLVQSSHLFVCFRIAALVHLYRTDKRNDAVHIPELFLQALRKAPKKVCRQENKVFRPRFEANTSQIHSGSINHNTAADFM
jgi:hypothetical protein